MSQIYAAKQKRNQPDQAAVPAPQEMWGEVSPPVQAGLAQAAQADPHGGRRLHLDQSISERMQEKFGIRMDQVELRESDQAARMDARAFARGNVVQFAPGQFRPDTPQGQQLLQHELSHVAQQARGQVHADVPGLNINASEGLEHQADLGVSAGSGAPVAVGTLNAAAAPIQGDFGKAVKGFFQRAKRTFGFGRETRKEDRAVDEPAAPRQTRTDHSTRMPWQLGYAKTAAKEFVGGKAGALAPSAEEKEENLRKAEAGDYSRLARTDKKEAQSRLFTPRKSEIMRDMTMMTPEDFRTKYAGSTTQMMDPVNRKSMSEMSRDRQMPQAYRRQLRELTEDMDTQVMVDTMRTPTRQQRDALVRHYETMEDQKRLVREYQLSDAGKTYLGGEGGGTAQGAMQTKQAAFDAVASNQTRSPGQAAALADADLQRSQNAGDATLRLMFLMQLGDFQRTDKDAQGQDQSRTWDQTMANAFSHGGRTGFIFGKTDQKGDGTEGMGTDDVAQAIFGDNMGQAAGMHTRAAGTHYIRTGRKGKTGRAGYQEVGGISAAMKSKRSGRYQHYGMDMAIGGIGREGVAGEGGRGQMINADGRSGHLYVGKKTSTAKKGGGLLVGLESDSPYRMNQTGHMHNAAAQAEENSSTGGMKADIQGKKYGGRTVDLSGLQNEELVQLLGGFTQHVNALRGGNPAQQAQYDALLQQVAGKRMDAQGLYALLDNFVEDKKRLSQLVTQLRP